ncbi:MAG: hypothetical protein JXQ71_15915 [Verrucomicrobia bacterium]|nr:hypothetical protein [Verrucomicrobiota bacterium]
MRNPEPRSEPCRWPRCNRGNGAPYETPHASLFGVSSPEAAFEPVKLRPDTNRTTVRLQQTYARIPVFAAQVNMQVSARGGVLNASSDIARNFEIFDTGIASIVPTLAPATVLVFIQAQATNRHPEAQITNAPPPRGGFHAIFGRKPRSGSVERAARGSMAP